MKTTVSNEVLAVGAKSMIGPITEAFVADVREQIQKGLLVKKETITSYCKLVKQTIGIDYTFEIEQYDGSDAGIEQQVIFLGHAGTWYYSEDHNKLTVSGKNPLRYEAKIDLKNVMVVGGLADELKFRVVISSAMIGGQLNYSIREVTAIILHEYGHSFNTFSSLGDYVWLNYYLTDGIEVLQGKRRNEFNLEVLDEKWLLTNIPKADRDAFANERSDGNVRRAILSAYQMAPRHHLLNNPVTAMRREEQMADMFPTRLGYGRELVTGLAKLHREFGNDIGGSTWYGDFFAIAAMIAFSPFVALAICMSSPVNEYDFGARYDNPQERLLKIRRDLIAQLKQTKSAEGKDSLRVEIEAIDEVLKDYDKNRSVYDSVLYFFRPARRRERDYTEHEEQLESLLNNDLFVQALKLKSFTS